MSTIVLAVSYKLTTKKISCTRSYTLGQVIQTAFKKFGISSDEYWGELVHNGKTLDGSMPLRLTNLTNNSRVDLKVKEAAKDHTINVKLSTSPPQDQGLQSMIAKFNAKVSLSRILEHFEESKGVKLAGYPGYTMSMSISNTSIPENDFVTTTLMSVVGSLAPNTVIRLSYTAVDNSEQARIQQEVVERQMKGQQEREQKKRELQASAQAIESENRQRQAQQDKELQGEQSIPQEDFIRAVSESTPAQVPQYEPTRAEYESTKSQTVPPEQPASVEESTHTVQADKTQLYVPGSGATGIYENPDSDYELTVSHAQMYQRLVRESARPKKNAPQAPRAPPSVYHIRLKFPDRSILQLDFADAATTTLGTLVSRIDDILLSHHRGKYNLKLGHPPFAAISLTAKFHATLLHSLPDFQTSSILIIWEPEHPRTAGPFVESSLLSTSSASELPEVQLESQRASLPEAAPEPPSGAANSTGSDPQRTQLSSQRGASAAVGGKKVPKWFRTR